MHFRTLMKADVINYIRKLIRGFFIAFFLNVLKKKRICFEISCNEGGQGMAKVIMHEV